MKVIYTAYFVVDPKKLIELFPPKHEVIFAHHSTICYRPENGIDDIKVGNKILMQVIGRVSDIKADALLVKSDRSEGEYPHITLSCVNGIRPNYTNEMIKKAVDENRIELFQTPIEIEMVEGYFDGKEDVIQ